MMHSPSSVRRPFAVTHGGSSNGSRRILATMTRVEKSNSTDSMVTTARTSPHVATTSTTMTTGRTVTPPPTLDQHPYLSPWANPNKKRKLSLCTLTPTLPDSKIAMHHDQTEFALPRMHIITTLTATTPGAPSHSVRPEQQDVPSPHCQDLPYLLEETESHGSSPRLSSSSVSEFRTPSTARPQMASGFCSIINPHRQSHDSSSKAPWDDIQYDDTVDYVMEDEASTNVPFSFQSPCTRSEPTPRATTNPNLQQPQGQANPLPPTLTTKTSHSTLVERPSKRGRTKEDDTTTSAMQQWECQSPKKWSPPPCTIYGPDVGWYGLTNGGENDEWWELDEEEEECSF